MIIIGIIKFYIWGNSKNQQTFKLKFEAYMDQDDNEMPERKIKLIYHSVDVSKNVLEVARYYSIARRGSKPSKIEDFKTCKNGDFSIISTFDNYLVIIQYNRNDDSFSEISFPKPE